MRCQERLHFTGKTNYGGKKSEQRLPWVRGRGGLAGEGARGNFWSEGSGVSQGQGLGYTNVSFVKTCLNVCAFYLKNCKQMLNST